MWDSGVRFAWGGIVAFDVNNFAIAKFTPGDGFSNTTTPVKRNEGLI